MGVLDPAWGQVVAACVVGPSSAEPALRAATEALEPWARPRRFVFVEAMPTDPSGKPDRAALAKLTA